MSVFGSVKGFRETIANLAKLGEAAKLETMKLVEKTAINVQREAVRSIQRGPKTGRVYTRGGTTHRASAPGQPPATDTGALASSVQRVTSDDGMQAAVGTGLDYGAHLEFGTKDIEPRPWLYPALEKNRAAFKEGAGKIHKNAMGRIRKG